MAGVAARYFVDEVGLRALALRLRTEMELEFLERTAVSIEDDGSPTELASTRSVYNFIIELFESVDKMEVVEVDALPATGEPGKIYIVPVEVGDPDQGYYKYMWIAGRWVPLGKLGDINLEDYWSKESLAALPIAMLGDILDEVFDRSPPPVPVTGIAADVSNLTLNTGDSETITYTITPNNATNKDVVWTSDDATIATVTQSGLVYGASAGNTTVTVVTVDGGYQYDVDIEVL